MQKVDKISRRPKLDGLKGGSTIPLAIRNALNIPDGVLVAPFKEFIYSDDSRILYGVIIIALDDISKLAIKEAKIPGKGISTKIVMINGDHVGQMLMYNAADRRYYEINADLERDKGKRRATIANEKEGSKDERSVGQENLHNKDEDDRGNRKKLRHGFFSDSEENKGIRRIISDNHLWRHSPESSFLKQQPLYRLHY
ncbi:hypothetical protein G6F56_009375 [Rhizopus delemar]|nr:hypothetical protein G6F56_009375 [Rhizopus delemar]